uniref:Alpha-2-HS-glycoprotein 2 n=1 Tax=Gouania willdenowi TaxID=441366 RepID=A0A8C5GBB1_GOUWI
MLEVRHLVLMSVVFVGLVLSGAGAQVNVLRPLCDSPEAEEAALLVQDYLNAQHMHGYKYVLNRIEDIKIYTQADGNSTYLLELDLLETECHVLDPTPVSNCSVRRKIVTAVEGDCDVVLKKVSGALMVTDYKCKTEGNITEDNCVGCHSLLPLNHTSALEFVHISLETFNNRTKNETFLLHEVGRLSSRIVSGGLAYKAEYVVVEGNCTDEPCVPLNDVKAVISPKPMNECF